MAVPSTKLLVAVSDSLVRLRVSGRATCAVSVDFRKVVEGLRQRGHTRFLLDLTECLTMDSTFLGVLAGFVARLAESPGNAGQVVLVNANARVTELLDNLGALPLFQLVRQAPGPAGTYQSIELQPADKLELSRTALAAHQELIELDPANEAKFKEVVRFLAEELKEPEK